MEVVKKPDRHQQTPYPLRLPADIKQALTVEASKSHRSLNGEIVCRLEKSLEPARPAGLGAQQ